MEGVNGKTNDVKGGMKNTIDTRNITKKEGSCRYLSHIFNRTHFLPKKRDRVRVSWGKG